jgi:hypothetical protein
VQDKQLPFWSVLSLFAGVCRYMYVDNLSCIEISFYLAQLALKLVCSNVISNVILVTCYKKST